MMALLLFVALVLTVWKLKPRKNDFLERCEYLSGLLPGNQLESMLPYLSTNKFSPQECRRALGGVTGLIRIWLNMTVHLRIIQSFYDARKITRQQTLTVWTKVVGQTWFTVWGLPEIAVSWLIPGMPLIASMEAARFYRDLVYRTDTLCSIDNAPLCIIQLRDLL